MTWAVEDRVKDLNQSTKWVLLMKKIHLVQVYLSEITERKSKCRLL
jgi:hypothetical protein